MEDTIKGLMEDIWVEDQWCRIVDSVMDQVNISQTIAKDVKEQERF